MEMYKRIGSKMEHTFTLTPISENETNAELRMYFKESGEDQIFPMHMKRNIDDLIEELMMVGYSLVDS